MISGNSWGSRDKAASKASAVVRIEDKKEGSESREMTWCPIRVARAWPPNVVPCIPMGVGEVSKSVSLTSEP